MDPIADLLTIIRNGYSAKKEVVSANYSKVKHSLADTLRENGYLDSVKIEGKKEIAKKKLVITLRYIDGTPAITTVKRVSKPSVRIYASARKVPSSLSGTGITIVSTSKGIMTNKKARKEKLGGEIICQVY
jgi:small subunit ribosomal protein S8